MSEKLKQLRTLRNLTKGFGEVQQLVSSHNSLKKQIRTIDRKLKTIEIEYAFINDITAIDASGEAIEVAAKSLFKKAGFADVRLMKRARPKREDLQIWCNDCLILVECKGDSSPMPKDKNVGQIKKYIDHRANIVKSQLPVFGFTVLNHDNRKAIENRHKKPIDKHKEEYALAGQYGVVTSIELVNGFAKLKNNEITFEQFKSSITKYGLITFGVWADKP